MSGKNNLKMRQLNNFSFLISNIFCKIMIHDLLDNQNILKDIFEDKRGQCQTWWRREKVEIRLEFFESSNGTTDFLLWNSEQRTGEWLLHRKKIGTFFTSKWMIVRWFLRLPDSENVLDHSLQGRRVRVFFKKLLLTKNGFSWEITSPQEIQNTSYFYLINNFIIIFSRICMKRSHWK